MGEDQLDDLELDGPITLRILDGIAWDFAQAKWWRWWKTVKCGGLLSSCCRRNPHEKRAMKKEEEFVHTYDYNSCIEYCQILYVALRQGPNAGTSFERHFNNLEEVFL